ncbi:MAG: 4-(cytidine 5'-diphospho)-2-C-methyl-D-erythritol kinase [Candidatus Saganbacteria bacterium]|nr:4-(cytidine 5'-diphospho)-2-C-methyl-D-erythritol kinase [Candidatus Saganbacteria bacterium]
MSSIILKSYAKINLSLKVLGLRPDGFHEIESVMQNVSLFDEVSIEDTEKDIHISCSDPSTPINEKNICYKAALSVIKSKKINKGLKIHIKKNIPSGAGLGGGSSDAAAVIIGLNKMWDLKMTEKEMVNIAAESGSDVPFFIVGGKALVKGRGEIIEKIPDPKVQYYVIIKPDVSIPTKWAYEEWDKQNSKSQNDLETVVISKYPIIEKIKTDLIKAGCSYSQMTGSGSAVFGTVEDEKSGKNILKTIDSKYPKSCLVHTVNSGVQFLEP